MIKTGIDVSVWNGAVNFDLVKSSGIDFVIIQAGYGKHLNQKDRYFEKNYANAKKANLNVGAYWYSYANSVEDAKQEALTCISIIKDKKFEYPIYFDVEEQSQFNKGKFFCDSIIETFCNELENNNYYAGLYMSLYYLKNYVSESVAKKYALWIADYSNKPTYNIPYGMWQYTPNGYVSGVSDKCDMNYSYIDYPSIIINSKLNGYRSKKTIEEIAKEVIKGLWGNGEQRKKMLTEAGYNYNEVQSKVNELLSPKTPTLKIAETPKSHDTVAKEILDGVWGNEDERKKLIEDSGHDYSLIKDYLDKKLKSMEVILKPLYHLIRKVIEDLWDDHDFKNKILENPDHYGEIFKKVEDKLGIVKPVFELLYDEVSKIMKDIMDKQHEKINNTTESNENDNMLSHKLKPLNVVAREVIDGIWGNGEEREKRLTDAGYNYKEVQKLVNALI